MSRNISKSLPQGSNNKANKSSSPREHAQEDDAELEKLHKNAIAGKLRHKRRDRGLGFEDSDSDVDEEDEAKRIRRRMYKKRKIEGDSLDALGILVQLFI